MAPEIEPAGLRASRSAPPARCATSSTRSWGRPPAATVSAGSRGSAIPEMWNGIILLGLVGVALSLNTRSAPRFAELRVHVYGLVQRAKQGSAPARSPRG